jgi:RNA polymerase sigma-70 factor (ECF subfamily)
MSERAANAKWRDEPAPDNRAEWSSLMASAQEGDRRAYRALLLAIAPYLRKLAARHHRQASDAEDAVQDILLTLHSIRHTYDPTRPFLPWLNAIAQRRIIDRLRQQGRVRARERPLEPQHETFAAPGAKVHEAAWQTHALREAVASLPEGQRRAITLLKLQEMSLKEVSAATGMSVGSLKVATHRAIRKLREILRRGDKP